MADIKYTPEQQRVIDIRNANVLVSAAAGSGKTAVLTKRILTLIMDKENPISVDRMLVLTFTNAAAAEMKERIGKEISKALSENPGDPNLWKQSALVSGAHISTIHKFCLFVIRNNFSDIDLDPAFRIMDEGEGKLLIGDIIEEIFEKHFADDNDIAFRHLIECYTAAGNEHRLADSLASLHDFVMSSPEPDKWFDKTIKLYECGNIDEISSSDMYVDFEAVVNLKLRRAVRIAANCIDLCNDTDGPNKAYMELSAYCLNILNMLENKKSYSDRHKILESLAYPRASSAKNKDESPEKRAEVSAGIADIKGILSDIASFYAFDTSLMEDDSRYVLQNASEIVILLKEITETYSQKKREKNIIDYSDMEHMALNILTRKDSNGNFIPSEAALEYRDFFEVVMVDEYQDSNYVQEYILRSICREDNYFMVGDVKQSIYRFRQACPDIFINKYRHFESSGINVGIDLNNNFRSRQEVLTFVNDIFKNIMRERTSSIEYDDLAALHYNASYPDLPGYEPEVLVLDNPDKTDLSETIEVGGKHAAEALMVANKINELISKEFLVYDKDTKVTRNIRYKDIVILLRAMDSTYYEVLSSQGIPVYMEETEGYFKTGEVESIINYLKIIDNPRQDIPFYGTLVSFFGGFSPEEVTSVRTSYPDSTLYDGVLSFMNDEQIEADSLKQKIKDFIQLLDKYRYFATYLTVRELLEIILDNSGYVDYITAFQGGNKRRANVLALLERASNYEKTSYHGVFHFIRYVNELHAKEVDYGEAGIIDENADVVRVMTIHKSKGLEFPVCFVCNTAKKYNTQDCHNAFIADMDCGVGLEYINPITREKRNTFQRFLLAEKNLRETIAEEIRVLYVALTRAKEKLYVTGEVADYDKTLDKLPAAGTVEDSDCLSANSILSHVLMGLAGAGEVNRYVRPVRINELVGNDIEQSLKKAILKERLENHRESDNELSELLRHKMDYKYPYEKLKGLYIKTSVSELKKKAFEKEDEEAAFNLYGSENAENMYIPRFAEKVAESDTDVTSGLGALRGSAYHRIMELIPYERLENCGEEDFKVISEHLKRNIEEGRLTEEQFEMVNTNDWMTFVRSSLGSRMISAAKNGQLFKEKSFFLGISADRVDENFPNDETMLVQGIIDVCFEEDGEMVLLDYKTDRVNCGDELVSRYKTQLDLYAEAIERIMNKPVKEKIIYSFCLKDIIVC